MRIHIFIRAKARVMISFRCFISAHTNDDESGMIESQRRLSINLEKFVQALFIKKNLA